MNDNNEQSFSQKKTTLLANFLSSEQAGEESLAYIAAHGFLTAIAICPETIGSEEWMPALFGGSPIYQDVSEEQNILKLLNELLDSQKKQLESGEIIDFPLNEEGDHEAELQNWCIGFVEALFLKEEIWFSGKEDEIIAELTLPVMALSGLFEEELEELIENEAQYESLIEQLPETLTDLYLLYRSPPET
jgi:uncharacterized protein